MTPAAGPGEAGFAAPLTSASAQQRVARSSVDRSSKHLPLRSIRVLSEKSPVSLQPAGPPHAPSGWFFSAVQRGCRCRHSSPFPNPFGQESFCRYLEEATSAPLTCWFAERKGKVRERGGEGAQERQAMAAERELLHWLTPGRVAWDLTRCPEAPRRGKRRSSNAGLKKRRVSLPLAASCRLCLEQFVFQASGGCSAGFETESGFSAPLRRCSPKCSTRWKTAAVATGPRCRRSPPCCA